MQHGTSLGTRRERFLAIEQSLRETWGELRAPIRLVAPGRVNLIGEHLDYNEGFVLPAAIDREILGVFERRDDDRVIIKSTNQPEKAEFQLAQKEGITGWGAYVAAMARALSEAGVKLKGIQGVIDSDLPDGSGLSSSAALEMLIGEALLKAAEVEMPRLDLIKIAQRAENDHVGVHCGIMDQFVIGMAKRGSALLLDTRSLESEIIPIDLAGHALIVSDTKKPRSLAESAFNERRAECQQALQQINATSKQQHSALRDVSPEVFDSVKTRLDPTLQKRAEHVITENARTLEAAKVLKQGDLQTFGALLDASHVSLRDLYEVSTNELDLLVRLARAQEGALGSRMTGAGFGGCTISLVRAESVARFVLDVARGYDAVTGVVPEIFVCTLEEGLTEIAACES